MRDTRAVRMTISIIVPLLLLLLPLIWMKLLYPDTIENVCLGATYLRHPTDKFVRFGLGNCWTVGDRAREDSFAYVNHDYQFPRISVRKRPMYVANWNVIVSDRKKGVRNGLEEFLGWFFEIREANVSNNNDMKYRFDSIETQTRLLADAHFLVRDYDAALSMYRLIQDEFK
jgi:ER-Golgi trafficking TRAPP I complex 85 kDa subunit